MQYPLNPRMPFGKYRGRPLKDIPDGYVKWAVENYTDPTIATMFSVELARRYPALTAPHLSQEVIQKIQKVQEIPIIRGARRAPEILG